MLWNDTRPDNRLWPTRWTTLARFVQADFSSLAARIASAGQTSSGLKTDQDVVDILSLEAAAWPSREEELEKGPGMPRPSRLLRPRLWSSVPSRSGHRPRTSGFASGSDPVSSQPDGRRSSAPSDGPAARYYLETGYALFAKRPPRPFPPPFVSADSSKPLRIERQAPGGGLSVHGGYLKGLTNGDDAILADECFVAVNDGVGAWSTRPQGHAA